MERLTTKLDDLYYIPTALCTTDRTGNVDDLDGCTEYCDYCETECSKCAIQKCFNKLAEYENLEEIFRDKMTDTACEFLSDKEEFGKWLDRNKWIAKKCDEYAREEEQGLLLRLPVPLGTTVYNTTWWDDKIETVKVNGENYSRMIKKHKVSKSTFGLLDISEWGKTVFLTKAEAEQKLKEMSEHE